VWIAVFVILMRLLGPIFYHGMHASATARRTICAVEAADATCWRMGRDLRQAESVVVPGPDATLPPGTLLLARFDDGTGCAYVLDGGTLTRWGVPKGQAFAADASLAGNWVRSALAGNFKRAEIAALPGAPRTWRVELAVEVEPAAAHGPPDKRVLSFVTAIHGRREVTP
jgi:hypothetical protein